MFDFLKPKTVQSVLASVYKAIDDLEVVAEQQEQIADAREAEITQLKLEQDAAYKELNHAVAVANRLRSLVEV